MTVKEALWKGVPVLIATGFMLGGVAGYCIGYNRGHDDTMENVCDVLNSMSVAIDGDRCEGRSMNTYYGVCSLLEWEAKPNRHCYIDALGDPLLTPNNLPAIRLILVEQE